MKQTLEMDDASDLLRSAEIISLANVVLVGTAKQGNPAADPAPWPWGPCRSSLSMGVLFLLPAGSLGAHCLRANPGRCSKGLLQVSPSPTKPKPPRQRAAAPIPLARCVEPLTVAVSPASLTLCPSSLSALGGVARHWWWQQPRLF